MNRLETNTSYAWYAVAEDDYTGRTVSDIWSFTTDAGVQKGKNKK